MVNDTEVMRAGLLAVQSARRMLADKKTYEHAIEVQIAEADYNRLALANRRAIVLRWINPKAPITAVSVVKNWMVHTGKTDEGLVLRLSS